MSILKIARMGHPVLRGVAEPAVPGDPAVRALVRDLAETLDDAEGAGLAAPQVHVPLRVVLCSFESGPAVLVNPTIEQLTRDLVRSFEGCLSVPGIRGAVDRCARVRLRHLDLDGRPRERVVEGWDAIVAQHECDHLDGILFVDRCDPTTLAFLPEYRRFGPLDPDFACDEE